MKKKEKIKAMADEVRTLTMDEASNMPGLWGKILPVSFKELGYQDAKIGGKKIFFELK